MSAQKRRRCGPASEAIDKQVISEKYEGAEGYTVVDKERLCSTVGAALVAADTWLQWELLELIVEYVVLPLPTLPCPLCDEKQALCNTVSALMASKNGQNGYGFVSANYWMCFGCADRSNWSFFGADAGGVTLSCLMQGRSGPCTFV